jgi:PIN domain nuclease of toxin-antitoxin system
MVRLLLDSNALIWLVGTKPMQPTALLAITNAQAAGTLYVSPMTAWEIALASQKKNPDRRPDLGGLDAATWFRQARRRADAKLILIGSQIALEAARVPAILGQGDPGDCFIVATARVKRLVVVTRDGPLQALATAQPDYLGVLPC